MEKKLIGFEFIWDEAPLTIEVAKRLKERGYKIVGVSLGKRWKKLLKKREFVIVSISDYLDRNWDKEIKSTDLNELEEKYGKEHDLNFFINTDRFLKNKNIYGMSKKLDENKFLYLHFRFWEDFFEKYPVDAFYTTGTSFLCLLSGMAVAREKGIIFKAKYSTRDNISRVVFVNNYNDNWESVNAIFNDIKKRDLTKKEDDFAINFLKEFREKSLKPSYMQHNWHISSLRMFFLKEFLKRFYRYHFLGWGKEKFDYVTPSPMRRVLKEIKTMVKRKIVEKSFFNKQIQENERFVLFTLQYQPEIVTDVFARWYSDQVTTIKYITSALPLGYKLYVKEHKVALGKRSGLWTFYNEIKKNNNVVMLDPYADSHVFIKKAKVVIVAAGTVGWEALLFGKPVITLGNTFYNNTGLVKRVENIKFLKENLKTLLDDYVLDEELLKKYIVAMRKGTYKGAYTVPHTRENQSKIINDKNVLDICCAIEKDMNNALSEDI